MVMGHGYLTIVARAEAGADDGGVCGGGTTTERWRCLLAGVAAGATGGISGRVDGHVGSLCPIRAGDVAAAAKKIVHDPFHGQLERVVNLEGFEAPQRN